jgi:hypothetical protein
MPQRRMHSDRSTSARHLQRHWQGRVRRRADVQQHGHCPQHMRIAATHRPHGSAWQHNMTMPTRPVRLSDWPSRRSAAARSELVVDVEQAKDQHADHEGEEDGDDAVALPGFPISGNFLLRRFNIAVGGKRAIRVPAQYAACRQENKEQSIGGRTHQLAFPAAAGLMRSSRTIERLTRRIAVAGAGNNNELAAVEGYKSAHDSKEDRCNE